MFDMPTDKQIKRIERLIEYTSEVLVNDYLLSKYPNADIHSLTKKQAQKIITGLQLHEKREPIRRVVGRDVW